MKDMQPCFSLWLKYSRRIGKAALGFIQVFLSPCHGARDEKALVFGLDLDSGVVGRDGKCRRIMESNSTREAYGAGPIVGYDFGPVSLQGTYNANIMTHHDFGGDFFNLRLIAPLF